MPGAVVFPFVPFYPQMDGRKIPLQPAVIWQMAMGAADGRKQLYLSTCAMTTDCVRPIGLTDWNWQPNRVRFAQFDRKCLLPTPGLPTSRFRRPNATLEQGNEIES